MPPEVLTEARGAQVKREAGPGHRRDYCKQAKTAGEVTAKVRVTFSRMKLCGVPGALLALLCCSFVQAEEVRHWDDIAASATQAEAIPLGRDDYAELRFSAPAATEIDPGASWGEVEAPFVWPSFDPAPAWSSSLGTLPV